MPKLGGTTGIKPLVPVWDVGFFLFSTIRIYILMKIVLEKLGLWPLGLGDKPSFSNNTNTALLKC
jgi:hypothetical protein